MGVLREKMIEEMKTEEFRIEDAEVLRCGDGGAGQALSSIPGSTHSRRDPHLSLGFIHRERRRSA